MAKQIVAKDINVEEYEFVDSEGKHLFSIRFSPADVNIARRYDNVVDWLNGVKIPDDAGTEELFNLSDELQKKIDYLLGARDASDICSLMNPFSPLPSGELYIEAVLENISKLIESEMDVRTKKVQSRMKKYTAKYHK